MSDHPIEGMMRVSMENIKDMVDVNTIVGDKIQCGEATFLIPISKVSFGFVSGGGEYNRTEDTKPFAGGCGAGITINPITFIAVNKGEVRLMPINSPTNRAVEIGAVLAEKITNWIDGKCKKDELQKEIMNEIQEE